MFPLATHHRFPLCSLFQLPLSSSSIDYSLFNLPLSSSSMDAHTTSTFITGDRFIPSRSSSNFALIDLPSSSSQSSSSAYIKLLYNACFGNDSNIYKYKIETSRRALTRFDDDPGVPLHPVKATRKVPSQPYKVLDAPELLDDFYSNILDWSLSNVLSVALRNRVHLWHHSSNKVEMLCELVDDSTVCSVGWAQCNAHLAVGTSTGELQIWDVSRRKRIRTMGGHSQRVGAIAWSSSLLSSGSRDKSILQRDIRAQEDSVSKLSGHKSEVCGLKWSDDNCDLASGGNDHQLFVWKQNRTQPVLKFREHTAAVRAIAWSPHRDGLLASGGGMADRCICIWNTTTDSLLSCVDTGSTVCNLAWSKNVNELVSTHGCNQDHIVVWRYPKMSKFAMLTGHKAGRVLHLAVSPDGENIVTGAGDERLNFWKVFPALQSQNRDREIGISSLARTQIR